MISTSPILSQICDNMGQASAMPLCCLCAMDCKSCPCKEQKKQNNIIQKRLKEKKTIIIDCLICHGSNIKCYKCEIIDLKNQIQKLKQQMLNYDNEADEKLYINHYRQQELNKLYTSRKYELSNPKYFITVTFDPLKFGMKELNEERQYYILDKIMSMYEKELIHGCFGSFEFQKNGLIHAHFNVSSYDLSNEEIEDILRPYFTDNRRNKIAVKCLPFKESSYDYILKDKYKYYRIKNRKGVTSEDVTPIQKVSEAYDERRNEVSDLDFGI